MAESPSHKLGQMIGHLIESIIRPLLEEFCKKNKYYLDYQGQSRTARKGKKVSLQDLYGNIHDLDYVIEKNGSSVTPGSPVGFIEVAWRRYTKHSRNKAQEIQGAILPLVDKYKWNNPFVGVILAGDFTGGSIKQLSSLGFTVLYFPYQTIVEAFKKQGVEIDFNEQTKDSEFRQRLKKINACASATIAQIKKNLIRAHKKEIDKFLQVLESKLAKIIDRIIVISWSGSKTAFSSVKQAMSFVENDIDRKRTVLAGDALQKYEIVVLFTNGDKIDAEFSNQQEVQEFLGYLSRTYVSG